MMQFDVYVSYKLGETARGKAAERKAQQLADLAALDAKGAPSAARIAAGHRRGFGGMIRGLVLREAAR